MPQLPSMKVVLAVMTLEPHGGVADQITNLALELPKYGVQPAVVVRNPLSSGHGYAAMMREAGIMVVAIRHDRYLLVRNMCRILAGIALPLIIADAVLRRKTLVVSQHTIWGVLRRPGSYAGLDVLLWLNLVRLRLFSGIRLAHFRKPDSWPWIARAHRLGYATIYSEDTIPWAHTVHYYRGLSTVDASISIATAVSRASATARGIPTCTAANKGNSEHGTSPQLDLAHGKTNTASSFVVGSLARLDPQKDIETLLFATRKVKDSDTPIKVLIFGDGPLRGSLETLANELELREHVEFRGAFAKTDLPEIMAQIDIVVLSSHYEGFGVVLVEGMAYGKPVIASAVGGVMDVVEDGVTGILFPEGDADALAKGILALSIDQQLYKRMTQAARERYLDRFTPERVVPQYVALYERLAT
ncbi:MAG: glycosyltransferase [Chloroflexota bacterium]